MLKKKILFTLLCLFGFCSLVFGEENIKSVISEEDQNYLVSNLNYLQYSVTKIELAEDKSVAYDEYRTVLNELDFHKFKSEDDILAGEYDDFMSSCITLELNEDEKAFLAKIHKKQMKNAWMSAFTSLGSIFVPGQSWKQMAASLVYTTVSNVVSIARQRSELNDELEKELFRIEQSDKKEIRTMQKDLFISAVKLLSGKSEKDIITEEAMKTFVNALGDDSVTKIAKFTENNFRKSFENFPPYWFEVGNAYQELYNTEKNSSKAIQYKLQAEDAYKKFEELKTHDVMKKDKTYIKLLKNQIQLYLDEIQNSEALYNYYKDKIIKCVDLITKNTLVADIPDTRAYLSKIYFLIDEYNKAKECVDYIIDTNSTSYLNDAVNLNIILNTILDNTGIYNALYLYDSILFGDESEIYAEKIETYNPEYIKKAVTGVKNFVTRNEGEEDSYSFVSKDLFYFTIPSGSHNRESLKVIINGDSYPAHFVEKLSNEDLYYIDYKWNDIKGIDKEQCIEFSYKSTSSNDIVNVVYSVTPIKYKYFEKGALGLERIGSSSDVENPSLTYAFGKFIDSAKYKFNVQDIDEKREDIRKDELKENKKAKGSYKLTNKEIEEVVSRRLSEELAKDSKDLNMYFAKIVDDFNSHKYSLYKPRLFKNDNDYYIVGLKSIKDNSINNELSFDRIGNVLLDKAVKLDYRDRSTNTKKKNTSTAVNSNNSLEKLDSATIISKALSINDSATKKEDYLEAIKCFQEIIKRTVDRKSSPKEIQYRIIACEYLSDYYANGKGVAKDLGRSTYFKNQMESSKRLLK